MSSKRCPRCGLINFAAEEACKRCGAVIAEANVREAGENPPVSRRPLWLLKRVLVIMGVVAVILLGFYGSLLKSSERLSYDQRQVLEKSIGVLEQSGFSRETFVLRNLVAFRSTDNWWNQWVGHREAYAATNFPFEVVTLYPEFFKTATDDTERAAILLHETYHLYGSGEAAALEKTWRHKRRLGWTSERYSQTKVWRNTRELTLNHVPQLFRCGLEQNADCTEF